MNAEWLRIGTGGVVPMHLGTVAKDGSDPGMVEGWASVYNVVDGQDDVVVPGAFAKTIKDWKSGSRAIVLTNGHDNTPNGVVGSVTDLKETSYGLKLAGKFSSAPSAQEIRTKAKEGHIGGLSIFGPIIRKSFESRDGRDIQVIHEAGLWAVGLTPIPANDKALVTASKSGDVVDEQDDPLSDVWICDMKSALSITSKTVRKTAIDLLVRAAYPTIGEAAKTADPAEPAVAAKTSELADASTYALSVIGESGPSNSSPGGEPNDSLADLLALEKSTTSSDLDAMLAELG